MGVRIRGTLGDIDPLNKVPFNRATRLQHTVPCVPAGLGFRVSPEDRRTPTRGHRTRIKRSSTPEKPELYDSETMDPSLNTKPTNRESLKPGDPTPPDFRRHAIWGMEASEHRNILTQKPCKGTSP